MLTPVPQPFRRALLATLVCAAASGVVSPPSRAQNIGVSSPANCSYNTTPGVLPLTPSCARPVFSPAPALTFSEPGTYGQTYLGQVTGNTIAGQVPALVLAPALDGTATLTASIVGGNGSASVTNLLLSDTPPNSSVVVSTSAKYLYGDVTVTTAATSTTGLLLTLNQDGLEILSGLELVTVSSSGIAQSGCGTNVTTGVSVTTGVALPVFGTQIWAKTVTVKNTSGAALAGPLELAFGDLSANARLLAGSGAGTCPAVVGLPYMYLANGLAAGASTTATVLFTNSELPTLSITFTPVVVAGGSVV